MVYMFSIMNYVAQAEMNIYLLWDVRRLIEIRKYDHIDGGIKVSLSLLSSVREGEGRREGRREDGIVGYTI